MENPREKFFFFSLQFNELASRGNFTREDILTVLTANHGDIEIAYSELKKISNEFVNNPPDKIEKKINRKEKITQKKNNDEPGKEL